MTIAPHTFGTIQLNVETGKWVIDAAPHVRGKLRRMFEVAKRASGDLILLDNTTATCRELEWIMTRFPLACDPLAAKVMRLSAAAQRQLEEDTRAVMQGVIALPPMRMTTPLRAYQSTAFDLVRVVKSLMLADEMGLGKTAVGAALAAYARPACIVCNTHMAMQWKRQLKKFAADLRVVIAPTTKPETLGKWDVIIVPYSKLQGWRDELAGQLVAIVFDEMQELRGMDTNKHAAAAHIAAGCQYRLGLTGTPIYNYGGEIFATMNILRPGDLGTYEEFTREWCVPVGSGKYAVIDPPALRAHLLDNGMMLRRKRTDVGRELPPISRVRHVVPFKASVFDALKGEMLQLAAQILSDSTEFTEKGEASRLLDMKLRQATGLAKAPYIADMVTEMVKEGEKVVLGAWHREVYDVLTERFKAEGVANWMYTGSESTKAKDDNVQAFMNHEGGGVFIMSLRSGAGLDGLQHCCNIVVIAELDWSPGVIEQLICRVARDGQQNGCTVIYPVVEAGSDPVVSGVLGLKSEQALGVVDGEKNADVIDAQNTGHRIKRLAADFLERYKAAA